jgi:hypothetical protein
MLCVLLALAVVATVALGALGALGAPVARAADEDVTPPEPFTFVPDAGDFQTGYVVAAPYNNIYISWQATVDDTSPVSYEVTLNGQVLRVVNDEVDSGVITKRIEVPEGRHVVGVSAVDAAGNRQASTHTLDVVIDKVSPTFTSNPLLLLRKGQVTDEGYPMRFAWTGTDVGSGLSHVRIGPNETCCYTTGPEQTKFDFTVEPRSAVAWRLWLYDGVGRTTKALRDGYVAPVDWTSTQRSDGWRQRADPSVIDGSEWQSTRHGDRFSVTTVGRSLAWVTTTGPTRGRADVILNGRVVDTVNLYSAEERPRRVVWAGKLRLGATSTVTIVNRSGDRRPTVGVDALLLQGA